MKRTSVPFILIFCICTTAFSQKKTIDSTAYTDWKTLQNAQLAPDGRWVSYSTSLLYSGEQPEKGPRLTLFDTKTKKEIFLEGARQLRFFDNGNWISYELQEDGHTTKMLQCLSTGKKIRWTRPVYFQEKEHSSRLVYTYSPAKDYDGQRLVLYDVNQGDSSTYEHVLNYRLLNDSELVYIQNRADSSYLIHQTARTAQILYRTTRSAMTLFTMNETAEGGMFMLQDEAHQNRCLYEFSLLSGQVKPRIDFDQITFPDPRFSMERSLYDTYNHNFIFPYTSPVHRQPNAAMVKDPSGVDIWSWDESTLARRQNKTLGQNLQVKSNEYVYFPDQNRFVQLTVHPDERVIKPSHGNYDYVFILDPTPYEVALDWTFEQLYDVYLVNIRSGKRSLILSETARIPSWSPSGRYSVFFDSEKKRWERIEINETDGTVTFTDLTSSLVHPFFDEDYDLPLSTPPYGLAGWQADEEAMLAYDRYDLWLIHLTDPQKSYCLTGSYGRENNIRLRLMLTEFDEHLDPKAFCLLRGFNEVNKSKGVYSMQGGKARKLMDGNFNVHVTALSRDSHYALWTRESYGTSPDLWWSPSSFKNPVRVSKINPQQEQLAWGSTRLVSWENGYGEKNEGVLYLPENYDAQKTYPTIVYFYENSTNERFTFQYPAYSESSINIPSYVSQGYVVFQPDIHFHIGHTGESSYNAVVSGTDYLIKTGIADPKHVGIHGHSFGAYQVAYIIGQTNLFTCAVPASVVTNLTSNYSNMRSNGLATMFMYESGQMRMGQSMYANLNGYIQNSPLFHAQDIQTPLLIFHCDDDNTVPFSEGRALFLAMRRLKKPAWLINYKGQAHDLSNYYAQIDWTRRLQQFFDYYLKDAQRPDWLTSD